MSKAKMTAFVRACGKVAHWNAMHDVQKVLFWAARRDALSHELGVRI